MARTRDQERTQSSFIHDKIRKTDSVPVKSGEGETFKYSNLHRINSSISKKYLSLKRYLNSIKQKPRMWADFVDWDKVKKDSARWLIEAFIEGLTANFATHVLLGFKFDPLTILAHGIVIKQGLSIIWRLRNGPTSTIPEKDE